MKNRLPSALKKVLGSVLALGILGAGFLAFAESQPEQGSQAKQSQAKSGPVAVGQVAQNNFNLPNQTGVGRMTGEERDQALNSFRNATREDMGGEDYGFDPNVQIPMRVQVMPNDDLESALNKAEKEYGMAPTEKNKETLDQLKKEHWARLQLLQMTSGQNLTMLPSDITITNPSGFSADGDQLNHFNDAAAFGTCGDDDFYCNDQTFQDFTLYGGFNGVKQDNYEFTQESLQERKLIWACEDDEDDADDDDNNCLRDHDDGTETGGGGGTTLSAQVNSNCFASPGTISVTANGNNVCSVSNGFGGGTANFTCTEGSTFNVVYSCNGTTDGSTADCHAFFNPGFQQNVTCGPTLNGQINRGGGTGAGAGNFTGSVSTCTCQNGGTG